MIAIGAQGTYGNFSLQACPWVLARMEALMPPVVYVTIAHMKNALEGVALNLQVIDKYG